MNWSKSLSIKICSKWFDKFCYERHFDCRIPNFSKTTHINKNVHLIHCIINKKKLLIFFFEKRTSQNNKTLYFLSFLKHLEKAHCKLRLSNRLFIFTIFFFLYIIQCMCRKHSNQLFRHRIWRWTRPDSIFHLHTRAPP